MSSLLIARVILLREVNGTVFRRGRLRRVCDGSAVYHICLCFLFNLLLSQMCDFTSMIFTVPLWGSEVANSKTEMHHTNTAVEVGMQRRIYAMSLLLKARVTSLRQAYATAFRKGCLTWTCDVTTIEREGDFTSLGTFHCVWNCRGCQAIM